jgi:nitrate reductase NapAB chaperone NapD
MEKALIIGKLSHRAPRDIIEQFKKIKGVTDTDLIFGPYDFYIVIKTDSKQMLVETSIEIRSLEGVLDTQTNYVVNFSDIRPEATGSYAE